MTMDITTAEPHLVLTGASAEQGTAEISLRENAAESLDLTESPKVRTRLRLYAILSALYVSTPARCAPCIV